MHRRIAPFAAIIRRRPTSTHHPSCARSLATRPVPRPILTSDLDAHPVRRPPPTQSPPPSVTDQSGGSGGGINSIDKHTARPDRLSLAASTVLSDPETSTARIVKSISASGFTVSDTLLHGPIIVYQTLVLLWDVKQYGVGTALPPSRPLPEGKTRECVEDPASVFDGWATDDLEVLTIMDPPPEIVVFGTGTQMQPMPAILRKYLLSHGMQVECLHSRSAASTYNVLAQEGRRVAAALLPLVPTSARTGKPLVTLSSRNPDIVKERELHREGAEQQQQQ